MSYGYVGLCEGCRFRHWVISGRGSRFLRCQRSFDDPSYPRYPQLPVLTCDGFDPGDPPSADADAAPDPPTDTRG